MSESMMERLRQSNETLAAENERLRGALGLRNALRHAAEQDEIERLRADNELLREGNERLRKALQDIAEDCDDDYPPSHGAIKYAVQDALRDKP